MGILIRRLFFCECFHLEKVSLNSVYHSKPTAKAAQKPMAVVRRQLQAVAADDGRQTWTLLSCLSRNSFLPNWVERSSLQ
jgi:hypothetical protein